MNEQSTKQKTTTGEPVEGQAPAPSTVPASTTAAPTSPPAKSEPAPAPGVLPQIPSGPASLGPQTLPPGYLKGGYHQETARGEKYLRSEYVEEYAQEIAASLDGMKPTEFEKLLRELKKSKKRTLPYEARRTAAAEMLPMAQKLNRHKKAPEILAEFVRANLMAIVNDETWTAFYRHCEAISGYLPTG